MQDFVSSTLAFDVERLHARTERRGFDAQELRRALFPGNFPFGGLEGSNDVTTLQLFEFLGGANVLGRRLVGHPGPPRSRRRVNALGQGAVESEMSVTRRNHRPFDDIL